jgi:hypothetical protein
MYSSFTKNALTEQIVIAGNETKDSVSYLTSVDVSYDK